MELWDLYTKNREKLNRTMVRGEKQPEDTYRIAVHICLFRPQGQMLIQQRQPFKSGWSNMWDFSAAGSAITGETSAMAAQRELFEELGIQISFEQIRPSLTIHFDGGFDDMYLIEKDIELAQLTLQPTEVKTAKWATIDEISKMIDDGTFVPYHKSLIELLFFMRNHPDTRTRPDTTSVTRPPAGLE